MSNYIPASFSDGALKLPRSMVGELVDLYLIKAMQDANVDPAVVHAFSETLMWICENNLKDYLGNPRFTKSQMSKWNNAINNFRSDKCN